MAEERKHSVEPAVPTSHEYVVSDCPHLLESGKGSGARSGEEEHLFAKRVAA